MTRQPLVARRAEELLGSAVVATAPVAGGDIATATRLRLSNGTTALMKTLPHAPDGFFAAEAAGLRWLAEASLDGGAHVPDVLGVDHECLIIRWVEPGKNSVDAATALGRSLAATHAAGAASFGLERDGFIGRLPMPNRPTDTWAEFYAARRVLPGDEVAPTSARIDVLGAVLVTGALMLSVYGIVSSHWVLLAGSAALLAAFVGWEARTADPSGVDYWTRALDEKRRSRGSVMVGFSESNEYKTKQAENTDVAVAYVYLLGRAPTPVEEAAWVALRKANVAHAQLLRELLDSQAYADRIT